MSWLSALPWLTEVAGVLAAAADREEEEVVEVLGEVGGATWVGSVGFARVI